MSERLSQPLPGGWAWATVGDALVIVRGVSFPKDVRTDMPRDGYIACLRTTNVQRQVEWSDLWYVPEKYVKREEQLVKPLDILISTANSLELVGKVAQVRFLLVPATLGAFIALIRVPRDLDPVFVYYQLASSEVQGSLRSVASTTTNISNISTSKLADLHLRFAPLPEQHRIIAEIETQFTRLDAGVAALKRAQANLKRYKAAVLKAACEGRLVPTEAELAQAEGRDYEPADALLRRILAERRAKWEAGNPGKRYKEPEAPAASDLPELPEGWVWATVECITIEGPQNGLYLPQTAYGTGTPILRIDDFQDGSSRSSDKLRLVDATPAQVARYSLKVGDLVINRVNSPSHLGKSLVVSPRNVPSLFESNMMRLRLSESIGAEFAELYLRTAFGRRQLTQNSKWAVNQASINQRDVVGTCVPLVPVAEQQRIVAEVERRLSVAEELERQVGLALQRAGRLRQAILKRAFEGKLVPQDPNDEPASALLERIWTKTS